MAAIVIATVTVGIVGILIGVLLGIASEVFKVEVDEKEIQVREALPGNNCGACGYPGCDGLAKAIASGEAKVNQCPVGGQPVAAKIAVIMGVDDVGASEKKVAFVKCKGNCNYTKKLYTYSGLYDCNGAMVVPGAGGKSCEYGCMGYGSCVKACEFDSIHIVDGIALVDKEKCVACGKCVTACPKKLIDMVPYKAKTLVQCNSQDKGKTVKDKCSVGCIGCTMCVKQCQDDAIHMVGNVALVDYSKCIECGRCAMKCPTKVIISDKLVTVEQEIA
ncbi:MAG: RnfABCDGE type electron transport complex subunit B [Lachnospiraceae bacterium]|nr:MAG: RnfABCDGE type electron transport complex subunit B [Lachnospiraceae bacterium]